MPKVGIVGASGYAGAEVLRLVAGHPDMEVAWATGDRQAGARITDLYPNLHAVVGDQTFASFEPGMVDGLDLVFLALPHGASGKLIGDLAGAKVIVDLAADFRLKDPALYPQWYGEEHPAPDQLAEWVYGLPELGRADLHGATRVAAPGCYPTSAALPLRPLIDAGLVETTGIIVDAASGVTGAGRDKYGFSAVDEDFKAYGLLNHRHTPEIEQVLGAQVLFTPHLVPMNRGILSTCYARPTGTTSTAELMAVLHDAYDAERFVQVIDEPPSTRATVGSNNGHVTVRYDERTGYVVALGAIDNILKGASGQAVQCANLALGLDEGAGLPVAGFYA